MHPITHAPPVETWNVRKPVASSPAGVAASQHHLASDIAAQVLSEGGNAVDAAVTAGLAIGAVEPWMSGLGGCGYMLVHLARSRETWCVGFGVRAPEALDPAAYPITGGSDADLFAWPAVLEDRNVQGPLSIAVPGMVAGHAAALERFGTRSWAEALRPAISLAKAGITVDWYATLKIAAEARALVRDPESARTYLPDGLPPSGTWGGPLPMIRLGRLADTLTRLAEAGAGDFYRGDIAAALARDARDIGSPLGASDLAGYEASIYRALTTRYRDATINAAPGLTAGPTLAHALSLIEPALSGVRADGPDADAYHAYASALATAYENRLATLGDDGEAAGAETCTTHMSVVDGEGNIVALTQTLLSVFGSRVMLPRTGILMNNGIMWFDPRPGRPNSIRAGRRPLSNMCPAIVERGNGTRIGIGASGGRRIMPAVAQLISFLVDYRLDLESATHLARIDMSGGAEIIADPRLDPAVHEKLAALRPVSVVANAVYPALYACPNMVTHDEASGACQGAAYVMSPWAKASAA
jgi:gamma-glutamyltranspeptidase/glutathione hydrolase